jgi:hypothetical protein
MINYQEVREMMENVKPVPSPTEQVITEKQSKVKSDHTYNPPGSHPISHTMDHIDHSITKVGEHQVTCEGSMRNGNTEARLKDKDGKMHQMELRDHHPIEGRNGIINHSYPMDGKVRDALHHALGKHLESQMSHYKEKVAKA